MINKINIAYLIDTISSNKAGTEKQLINIIQRLDPDLFSVTLICLNESPWLTQNLLPCETLVIGYRGFLKPGFPKVLWRYLQILRNRHIDIVQTFFEDAMFIGCMGKVLSKRRHCLIASRRDLGLGADEPGYHRIFKKLRPFFLKAADGVAANAEAIKKHIAENEKFPTNKICVISNGLDAPATSHNMPALFKENQSGVWIAISANLKPIKRIDLFLRAIACLRKNRNVDDVRAVILGEGRLRYELIQLAADLDIADSVHFMGSVDNVTDYLQYIDIGVLCSDKEGLPNAIMEYMACGLPVVATAVGGVSELVDDTNGICVPPGDYIALADALSKLVSSTKLRKELGHRSFEKVSNNYTWDIIMPQWENYYRLMAKTV
jgi:L-malate glycosyltransferase